MERIVVTLPPSLIRQTAFNWSIDWREQDAGRGTGGYPNVVIGKLPRWVGMPALLATHADIARMRAHFLAGRGRLAVYRLPMLDPVANGALTPVGSTWSDGATFGDGTSWSSPPVVPCPAGAAAGAVEIVVDETDAPAPIKVGQILSHADFPFAVSWRMDEGDGLVRLGVEMPLRRAIPAGDPVSLIAFGLFELAGEAPRWGYDLSRVSRETIALQEWLR